MRDNFTQRTTDVFLMSHFKIYSFDKKIQRWCSQLMQIVLTDLFRLSDGLANRSFCRSDISEVHLKSNETFGKKYLASDSKTVYKSRLILSKAQLIFFNGLFGNCIISKELTLKEFLYDVMLTQRTAQTFRWPCEWIILSNRHFESPTEVQLNSWWKTVSLWWRSSYIMQTNFT